MHDLSPTYMAPAVTAHLESLGAMMLEWPPKGTDMNVIESVSGILKPTCKNGPPQIRAAGGQVALDQQGSVVHLCCCRAWGQEVRMR